MDKPLDRGADTVKESIKKAEKDKFDLLKNFEDELEQRIQDSFEKNGKPGETITDYIKRTPVSELKKLALKDGGPVSLKGLSVADMKAIFRSENDRDATSPKELVRGVKMYLKNLDIDGIPFGTFGKKD